MSIFEIVSRPTHRSLMNKSKDDLATLVMQLIDINAKLKEADQPSEDVKSPITREWVVSEYGMSCVIITDKLRVYVRPSGRVDLNGFESPLPHIRTRGQLRQLLAALGWRGEEKHGE